jgi:peptidoglycan hydrolase-like protein with peptidoglycan-binding domain
VTVIREAPPTPPALVGEAQRRLARRGWYVGPIDGELSPATRVALAKLQRERGLPATGQLDAATLDALGLEAPPAGPGPEAPPQAGAPEEAAAPAPPLEAPPEPARPQPPPQALAGAHEEARRLLTEGAAAAAPLPAPGMIAAGPLAADARAMDRSGEALARAREAAFDRLLQARADGGWALLPQPLIDRLETALAGRSLLVHGPDGRLGADDEAAIRWVERSVGLAPTGRPSLRLLEALGIDPSPMFAP